MSTPENQTIPPPVTGAPQDERTLALITHLSGIVLSFVVPLIMWLVNKDAQPAKPFVTAQAKEALNFQITLVIAYIIALVLMVISFGLLFFLPTLVWVTNVVFCIVAAIKVNNGEDYRYPMTLRLIK